MQHAPLHCPRLNEHLLPRRNLPRPSQGAIQISECQNHGPGTEIITDASYYATFPLARFLLASAIITLPKKSATPLRPVKRRIIGIRTAQTRGGKRWVMGESGSRKGCGSVRAALASPTVQSESVYEGPVQTASGITGTQEDGS